MKLNYSDSSWLVYMKQATQLKHRNIIMSPVVWHQTILCRISLRRIRHLSLTNCCHCARRKGTGGKLTAMIQGMSEIF